MSAQILSGQRKAFFDSSFRGRHRSHALCQHPRQTQLLGQLDSFFQLPQRGQRVEMRIPHAGTRGDFPSLDIAAKRGDGDFQILRRLGGGKFFIAQMAEQLVVAERIISKRLAAQQDKKLVPLSGRQLLEAEKKLLGGVNNVHLYHPSALK